MLPMRPRGSASVSTLVESHASPAVTGNTSTVRGEPLRRNDSSDRRDVPSAPSDHGGGHQSTRNDHSTAHMLNDVETIDGPLTHIAVECRAVDETSQEVHTRNVFASFDALSVDATENIDDHQVVTAVFHRVCDATHAAVELVRRFRAAAQHGGSTDIVFRIALQAVDIDVDADGRDPCDEAGVAGHRLPDERRPRLAQRALERTAALLAHAGAGQVITTSATAAVAGPTLPAGAELVDRGDDDCGCDDHDRLYELRVHNVDRIDGTPVTASNLDWARRLAGDDAPLADEDLAVLEDRWNRALTGSGTVVLVTSPDGSIASAAAAELALRVHAENGIVLRGSWDRDARRPYGAFREALGIYAAECSLARVRTDLDRQAWDVAAILPELGARLGRPPAAPRPAHDEGCRIGDAVSDWFRAIAARDHLLLVFDNVQWADRASLTLCEQLSNDLADRCALVLLCGAERDLRAECVLDATRALAAGDDREEHWIPLERT